VDECGSGHQSGLSINVIARLHGLLHARGLATVGGRARRGANPTEAVSQLVDGTGRMHGMFMIAPCQNSPEEA